MDSTIYALDFDGVICDSATELAHSGWKCAQTVFWTEMQGDATDELVEKFRLVRPWIETGYESILLVRLLYQGVSTEILLQDYEKQIAKLIEQENLSVNLLKQKFGETRDQWIKRDQTDWLSKNPLFAGMTEKLASLKGKTWYIITTKEERFVKHILADNGIALADENIFGLDRKLSKQQVLEQLTAQHPEDPILFVEDRLPTLQGVQDNPALTHIQMQFVDWGYNTEVDRDIARQQGIEVISFNTFLK